MRVWENRLEASLWKVFFFSPPGKLRKHIYQSGGLADEYFRAEVRELTRSYSYFRMITLESGKKELL